MRPPATGAGGVALLELHLREFRCFAEARFPPSPAGTTVITGPNGTGKTSLLEAVGYLGTQRSFRGASREVMVRAGSEQAVLRAELRTDDRPVLVEAELVVAGRSRLQVNRQPVTGRSGLGEQVPVTVFSPDDLQIVQGGPAGRRVLLDDALGLLDRRAGALVDEVERTLRQRGSLLRQAGGRLSPEVESTLAVWDDRLAASGTALATAREELAATLAPGAARAYAALAGTSEGRGGPGDPDTPTVGLAYRRSWQGPLEGALVTSRRDDLRRAPPRWDPTATSSRSPSGPVTHGCRGPRGSSAVSRWPCGWPSTSW